MSGSKLRIRFLTYYDEARNTAPSGGEIYCDKVLAPLKDPARFDWAQWTWHGLPRAFRGKGLSHAWYLLLFLCAPIDIAIVDAGYLGRCALPLFLLRLRRKRVVLIFHHLNSHMKANPLARAYDLFCAWLGFRASTRALLSGPFSRDEIVKNFGYRKPMLLAAAYLTFEPGERGNRPAGGPVRCLCVGTVEPRKYSEAEKAPPGLEFEITVAGKDTLLPEYAAGLKARASGNKRIRFMGYADGPTLGRLYREADLFLFPSKWEGFGIAVLEALAHGIPVVAFNASSMPYLVRDGDNGLLVRPYDLDAFVAAATALIADSARRRELAARCALPAEYAEGWGPKAERVRQFVLE
jgi:glycosyltransferase involved in cell wall biosynthesis